MLSSRSSRARTPSAGAATIDITIIGLNYAPEPTGIARYTSGLAEGLAARGDSVTVVTGFPHYPQWRIDERYTGRKIVERSPGLTVTRLRHYVPALPRLVNRLVMEIHFGLRSAVAPWARPRVAVIVTPALFSAGIAMARAKLRRIPSTVWVQDIYSLGVSESGAGGGISAAILRRIEGGVLRSAESVVVIHDRFKRYLVKELGVDPLKITVVRNWSRVDDAGSVDRAETRSQLGWGSDEIIALHAGNMGAKQGLEHVVRASAEAAAANSPTRFVLMGDGNQRAMLAALQPNDNLTIMDPVSDDRFAATLSAADVLLVNERPGLTEMSVPSKLTSYFRSGRPVIAATDATSVTAEEVESSQGGLRVDADDPSGLVRAIEELIADPGATAALAAAGLAFSDAELSEESAIGKFRGLVERLAR